VTLLDRLFLVHELPAWHDDHLKRLVKTPKLHVGDSHGLARGPRLPFCCQNAHIVLCLPHEALRVERRKERLAEAGAWRHVRGYRLPCGARRIARTIGHPNQRRYAGQRIFIVKVEECVCLVPFVEDDEVIFLKTIVPSRKMTKQYLGGDAE